MAQEKMVYKMAILPLYCRSMSHKILVTNPIKGKRLINAISYHHAIRATPSFLHNLLLYELIYESF